MTGQAYSRSANWLSKSTFLETQPFKMTKTRAHHGGQHEAKIIVHYQNTERSRAVLNATANPSISTWCWLQTQQHTKNSSEDDMLSRDRSRLVAKSSLRPSLIHGWDRSRGRTARDASTAVTASMCAQSEPMVI
jgi:hypothetical protein